MKTVAGRYRGARHQQVGSEFSRLGVNEKGALVLPAHLPPPLPHSLTEANVLLAAPQQRHERFANNGERDTRPPSRSSRGGTVPSPGPSGRHS